MKVAVKESCMVKPAKETPRQRLWLSNLDQLFVKNNAHMTMLQPYRHNGSHNFFDGRVMKESLSQALVAFFPAAGRLARDESGRFEIDCGGQGVLFVEAETDATISDMGEFHPAPELLQLIPQVDFSKAISSIPLLHLQVTRFRCGGVCLGIGYHHGLSDGTGSYNLFTTWSLLARGLPAATNLPPPLLDRTILRSRSPPAPTCQHPEYDDDQLQTPRPPRTLTSTMNLNLSVDQIARLKDEASNYTTYEVVAAHIWRCVTLARRFAYQDQTVPLHVTVDGRRRFDPPLPRGYFGNCLFYAMVEASPAELGSEPLQQTAKRIRRAIKRIDDVYMRSAIDYLDRAGARIPGSSGSPHLKVVSWAQLHFALNFGWGDPIFIRAPNFEGSCFILSKPNDGDDGVSFSICLDVAAMERFKGLLNTTWPQLLISHM
ncbi:unnamed protein product [Linum trigynum]|uniref:Uncharacterized protein n=1 Tax=Linum trigynum TaxID=586398 RepID=A0AAV2DJR2_9ROSI